MYTQEFLDNLITCKKVVLSNWTESTYRGSVKKVLNLKSEDGTYNFTVFYTINNVFKENFSIGLVFITGTDLGKINLLRCNGLHGPTEAWGHHKYTHSHKLSAEELKVGNKMPNVIEKVDAYSTFETALSYFGSVINLNVKDKMKYFPTPEIYVQGDIFTIINGATTK